MEKQAEYVAGWIETSIHDFLAEIAEPPSGMAYALITCLDSNFDGAFLLKESKHLEGLRDKCELIGSGILTTTQQLLAADRREQIFFGFDEVWFFPHADIRPKPTELIITCPAQIGADHLNDLIEWMQSNDCSLGLGDGMGMNFCLKARGMAKNIVRALSQAGLEMR